MSGLFNPTTATTGKRKKDHQQTRLAQKLKITIDYTAAVLSPTGRIVTAYNKNPLHVEKIASPAMQTVEAGAGSSDFNPTVTDLEDMFPPLDTELEKCKKAFIKILSFPADEVIACCNDQPVFEHSLNALVYACTHLPKKAMTCDMILRIAEYVPVTKDNFEQEPVEPCSTYDLVLEWAGEEKATELLKTWSQKHASQQGSDTAEAEADAPANKQLKP